MNPQEFINHNISLICTMHFSDDINKNKMILDTHQEPYLLASLHTKYNFILSYLISQQLKR